ncbi:MAG: hypothetical protein ABII88_00225 [Candidatus Omnitrophota bacterium]
MKKRIFLKVISVVLIQAFLMLDFCWAGGNEIQSANEYGKHHLAPALQLTNQMIQQAHQQVIIGNRISALNKTFEGLPADTSEYGEILKVKPKQDLVESYFIDYKQKFYGRHPILNLVVGALSLVEAIVLPVWAMILLKIDPILIVIGVFFVVFSNHPFIFISFFLWLNSLPLDLISRRKSILNERQWRKSFSILQKLRKDKTWRDAKESFIELRKLGFPEDKIRDEYIQFALNDLPKNKEFITDEDLSAIDSAMAKLKGAGVLQNEVVKIYAKALLDLLARKEKPGELREMKYDDILDGFRNEFNNIMEEVGFMKSSGRVSTSKVETFFSSRVGALLRTWGKDDSTWYELVRRSRNHEFEIGSAPVSSYDWRPEGSFSVIDEFESGGKFLVEVDSHTQSWEGGVDYLTGEPYEPHSTTFYRSLWIRKVVDQNSPVSLQNKGKVQMGGNSLNLKLLVEQSI